MNQQDELLQENQALRNRLSRLSEASLQINGSLDINVVLQEVIDNARHLTNARYGVIASITEAGGLDSVLTSGTTEAEHRQLVELPAGTRIFDYFSKIPGPLRVDNYPEFAESVGLDGWLPMTVFAGLAAPIRHRGEPVGIIWLGHSREDRNFSEEDVETLVMFASQAAMVISNARRYRDEMRSRADLETLIGTTPVGVAVFDARTGAPVSTNREWMRIIDTLLAPGEPAETLRETLNIRRADGRELCLADVPMDQLLRAGERVRAEEMVFSVPGGRSVTVLLNGSPILSEDGQVESLIVTMQDMTPLKEVERLRAEFLAMVSHELRTPLATVRGSVSALLDEFSDMHPAEMRQFHRIILEQTDRMRALIADLLDVARIETGTLPVSPQPTDLAVLIGEAGSAFRIGGHRHNLRIDVPPDLPWVMGDRSRIIQVLGNLLTNAARHSPESSTIRVSAAPGKLLISVSVSDEGRGIPAESLPHLFMKFSRIEAEEQGGDTGLGLAVCKGIVEAHGGRIWAESDGPGLGARFTFTLPTVEEAGFVSPEPSRQHFPPSARGSAGEQLRILAVDDDDQALRYIRGRPGQSGLCGNRHRGPGGRAPPGGGGEAPPGAAGPHAARGGRHRPDEADRESRRRAGDLRLRLRPGPACGQGLRDGRRRLRGQTPFPHGTGGPDPGGPAPAVRRRAFNPLCDGRPGHRLRAASRDAGWQTGGSDGNRVPVAGRAIGQCGAGGHLRAPAEAGLGHGWPAAI